VNRSLTSLNLGDAPGLGDEAMAWILNGLLRSTMPAQGGQVKTLFIEAMGLGEVSGAALDLWRYSVTCNGAAAERTPRGGTRVVATHTEQNPVLQAYEARTRALSQMLVEGRHELDIAGLSSAQSNIAPLAAAFGARHLTRINFHRSQIGDKQMAALVTALNLNQSITELDLCGTGAGKLSARALRGSATVVTLDVSENKAIAPKEMTAMLSALVAPGTSSKLCSLSISGTECRAATCLVGMSADRLPAHGQLSTATCHVSCP